MRRRLASTLALALALALHALTGAPALAQRESVPWSVTLTATMNPLPIGSCGAVWLVLKDSTGKDAPRNAQGYRVTIADFDMTVASAREGAAVGSYNGASSFSACACQAGRVGETATITATYPARALAAKARVPGVAFQAQVPFTLSAARGTFDPPGCSAPTPMIVSAGAALVGTVTASSADVVGTPAGSSVPPPSSVPVAGQPLASVPSGGRTVPATAPPPSNARVTGTPAEAVAMWSPPLGSGPFEDITYRVERWKESDPACCRAASPTLYSSGWYDPVQWSGTWIYRITAIRKDGRQGFVDVKYVYAEPPTPSGFKATRQGNDAAVLSWLPVPGASYYIFGGPPTTTAFRVNGTSTTVTGLAAGTSTWQVSAMFERAGSVKTPQGSPFVSTSLTLAPWKGRYRIVADAIRVDHETVDTQFSSDGKGDEVYVSAFTQTFDHARGTLLETFPLRVSATHGDINGYAPPVRVRAGSSSGSGGLRGGDVVSPVFGDPAPGAAGWPEFILWEGELTDGLQDLVVRPMLWELDRTDDWPRLRKGYCLNGPCGAERFLTTSVRSVGLPAVKAAFAAQGMSVVDGDIMWMTPSGYIVHIERQDGDRPIGLDRDDRAEQLVGEVGRFRDRLVVLSREKIERALAAGSDKIAIRFWEHWSLPNVAPTAITSLAGDYTLTIRVERVP
jgi:hypothetical protein